MSILDYITMAVFCIGILTVGISLSRQGKNMKSFFGAGGGVAWWIAGLSLFMGFHSAGTFVVWGSIAYSHGLVSVTIQMCMCVAGLLVGSFIANRWKRMRVLTAAEYVTNRLGKSTQKIYTYLFLLISMFTTGSFLYPVAKIVQVSTGVPLEICIILLGLFSILYVTAGGFLAVLITDVLQFIILTAAVIIVLPLSFGKIGGVENFVNQAPPEFFHIFSGEYTYVFIIAFALYNTIFLGGNWSYVQRYASVKTEKDARKAGFMFSFWYLISPILWMLPPMIYRVFNPNMSGRLAEEGAYLMMCKEALPSGLLGLMIGGMIFATASALNGALNTSASVFTNDIYKRLKPNSSDKTMMLTARLSTAGFGIIAIIIALLIPLMGGIVNVVISVGALTGVPMYMPIIWTLFSKRQTNVTVLTTTILSLFINLFFKVVSPVIFDFSLSRSIEMAVGVSVPIILLTIFEIYFKFKNKFDPMAACCEALVIQRKQETEQLNYVDTGKVDYSFAIRILGIGIGVTGVIIALLGINAGVVNNWMAILIGLLLIISGIFVVKKVIVPKTV